MLFSGANRDTTLSTGSGTHPVLDYADASWGNDLGDRKSSTGAVVKFNGNPICWLSRKPPTVATSTAEAEYVAISAVVSAVLWFKTWCQEVLDIGGTVPILSDTQSATALCMHDRAHQRTKHIDIKHHFIRDHVKKGDITIS